jgi:uncharacterized membrane protein YdjX (TVP38/TMEM64 family)
MKSSSSGVASQMNPNTTDTDSLSVSESTDQESSDSEKLTDTQSRLPEKFTWTKDRIILAIIFSVIMLISIALLVIIIVDKDFLFTVVRDYFLAPIIKIPVYARVILFLLLMILQSLFAPIPSELILLSGGMLFGLLWGSVIGVVGSMFSAAITFYLSKHGGRSIIDATSEKVKIVDRSIYIFDIWIERWGLWAILVGRAIPMIMFDPISYAAGLVNIKDSHYFIATFVGSIPRAIFYAYLGVKLLGNNPIEHILELNPDEVDAVAKQFNIWFFVIFGILVFMFIASNIIYYFKKRKEKKEAQSEEEVIDEKEDLTQNNNEESADIELDTSIRKKDESIDITTAENEMPSSE